MNDGLYRAFEDKHRRAPEMLKSRERTYLPLIRPLKSLYPDARAIDLGCGRGEWLGVLVESGFDACGVDLDDGVVAECLVRGLNVSQQDAISALEALPDASQAVVTGLQLAEHLPLEALQVLVRQALRVLRPAGLLILETANPENPVVRSIPFHLDPAHRRPVPPLLLAFLPEYCGFRRVKLLALREAVPPSWCRSRSIHEVLDGTSADYAVLAQADANPAVLDSVAREFDLEQGVPPGPMSGRRERDPDRDSTHGIGEPDSGPGGVTQEGPRAPGARPSDRLQLGRQDSPDPAREVPGRARAMFGMGARRVAGRFVRHLGSRPRLRGSIAKVARTLGLYGLLQAIRRAVDAAADPGARAGDSCAEVKRILSRLPPATQRIYRDLSAEIARQESR